MKNRIELTIEHKDPYTVELTNEKGDTFTYNPQKYEGLEDFLSGAKILLIADVSQAKRTVCPDCGDYGWIYSEDGTRRKNCPCHY
jgi:hypothetical protein